MDLRLSQCLKCRAYTLLGDDRGMPIALNVTPLDAVGFGRAVADGALLYRVEKRQNGASRGTAMASRTLEASWGPGGALVGAHGFRGTLHGLHETCPVREQRPVSASGSASGPPPAPATPGKRRGGPHPPPAPGTSSEGGVGRFLAGPASPRPSDVLGRCDICGRRVQPGESYWSITHGRDWIAGTHRECP